MSMEEVHSTLSEADNQLQQGGAEAREARRSVHRARTIADAMTDDLDRSAVWLAAVQSVHGYVDTIINTGIRKLAGVNGDFHAAVGDSENPAAQLVYKNTATAYQQLYGAVPAGSVDIPSTLDAVAEDIEFIRHNIEVIRGLGDEMLQALGIADLILEAVMTSEQNASESTEAYMRSIC